VESIKFYVDSTCLIGLARIDSLHLLNLLSPPVLVTTTVWQEVYGDSSRPGAAALGRARDAGLLEIVPAGRLDAFPELGSGESSVITAAAATRCGVLIDERKARAVIQREAELREAIQVVSGLVGLVLLAKRGGEVPSVRELLDRLEAEGLRMGLEFRRRVLAEVGEE
jgi:predicted nucleic acid-binding protein